MFKFQRRLPRPRKLWPWTMIPSSRFCDILIGTGRRCRRCGMITKKRSKWKLGWRMMWAWMKSIPILQRDWQKIMEICATWCTWNSIRMMRTWGLTNACADISSARSAGSIISRKKLEAKVRYVCLRNAHNWGAMWSSLTPNSWNISKMKLRKMVSIIIKDT